MASETNNIILYSSTALLSCIILFWVVYATGFNLHTPRSYELDALFSGAGIKTILDTGWILSNPNLGAPLTYSLADYPGSDSASFLIIKFLGLFTKDYALVLNLFFFLTYPITAIVSLFAFRRLGMKTVFAVVASLLFTFIPFHLMRGEAHVFLTTLYVIPIYVLLIVSLFVDLALSRWFVIFACIFAAASGIYYAFFACFLLLIAGMMACYEKQSWMPIRKTLALIAIIMITVIVNTLPSLIESHRYGQNLELGAREASESESFGLKMSQMLLPIDTHRTHFLKVLKQNYNHTAPLVNENNTATLGLIGSIGFIFLLIVLYSRQIIESNILYLISRLNLSAFLLGTVGGIGALYSYIISPSIRSYNRISVFIAFFCIFGFFWMLQTYAQKKHFRKKSYFLIATLLLAVGLYDQTEIKRNPDYVAIQKSYASDAKFIDQIEKIMPKGSMIFQLPVVTFPENPSVNKMLDYELFRAYLHSHTLHWSYGAIRGRKIIKWQKTVASKPLAEMLDELTYAGFTGIFLDRQGYENKNLEEQLSATLKQKPLVSEDGVFVFFDLRDYVNNVQNLMSNSEWYENIFRVQHDLFLEARWVNGFDHHEDEINDNKRWAKCKKATIRFVNYYSKPASVTLNFVLKTGYPENAHVKITGDVMSGDLLVNDKGTLVTKRIVLSPGVHYLYLKTDAKEWDKEGRRGYFRIEDLSI